MASIAHLAAGAACGAVYARGTGTGPIRPMVAFAVLALAPDLDLLLAPLRPAGTPFEHRVLTHAISAAIVLGPLIGAFFGGRGCRQKGAFFGGLALLSHGVIDAFTAAGKAPVLFWPFSWRRVASPWRPIPGTESFQEYFVPNAIWVYVHEAVLCIPLLLVIAWAIAGTTRSQVSARPTKTPAADPV